MFLPPEDLFSLFNTIYHDLLGDLSSNSWLLKTRCGDLKHSRLQFFLSFPLLRVMTAIAKALKSSLLLASATPTPKASNSLNCLWRDGETLLWTAAGKASWLLPSSWASGCSDFQQKVILLHRTTIPGNYSSLLSQHDSEPAHHIHLNRKFSVMELFVTLVVLSQYSFM